MKSYAPHWSVISVVGPDAASFVHNLCTNDIKRLAEGDACEAFFTDVKAHILAHAIVCRAGDSYSIVVTSPRAGDLLTHLDRYHIREDLTLALDSVAKPLLVFGPSDEGYPVAGLAARLLLSASSANGGDAMTDDEFLTYRLEHAFPLDGLDVDNRRLPQEVNRDALAISFTKGCYLGQETVARIDALGHVNRLLVKLRSAGKSELAPGDSLSVDGKTVGEVTSVSWSPEENALLLAYVRREHAAPRSELATPHGAATVLS